MQQRAVAEAVPVEEIRMHSVFLRLQVFNILCEQPEVVAAYLVPRARSVAARSDNETYIRFLTGMLLPHSSKAASCVSFAIFYCILSQHLLLLLFCCLFLFPAHAG